MSNFLAGGATFLLAKLTFRSLITEYFHLTYAEVGKLVLG